MMRLLNFLFTGFREPEIWELVETHDYVYEDHFMSVRKLGVVYVTASKRTGRIRKTYVVTDHKAW